MKGSVGLSLLKCDGRMMILRIKNHEMFVEKLRLLLSNILAPNSPDLRGFFFVFISDTWQLKTTEKEPKLNLWADFIFYVCARFNCSKNNMIEKKGQQYSFILNPDDYSGQE